VGTNQSSQWREALFARNSVNGKMPDFLNPDGEYEWLTPESIEPRSTCFDGNRDTVFVGQKAVQHCLK